MISFSTVPITSASPYAQGKPFGSGGIKPSTYVTLDPRGILAAAYFKNPDRHLYYYYYGTSSWNEELVASTVASLGGFNYVTVVYVYEQPHIIFFDSVTEKLKHAWKSNGAWTSELVNSTAGMGKHLSAIACHSGKICISYYDGTNTGLKYSIGNTGSWTTSTIEYSNVVDLGQFTSITLNQLALPVVSYYDATNRVPKVAEQDAFGNWTIEALPTVAEYGRWTSIVIGSDGTKYLSAGSYIDAYTDLSDGTLYYGVKPANGTWTVSVLTTNSTSAFSSVSLLPNGRPQVSARHLSRSAVFGSSEYIYYSALGASNQWLSTVLFPNDGSTFFRDVKSMVDRWGNPIVSYYQQGGTSPGVILHKPLDADDDQLPNEVETGYGASPTDFDSDDDGLSDGSEILSSGTSPVYVDSDGDGISDTLDVDGSDVNALNLFPDGSAERPVSLAWGPVGSVSYGKSSSEVAQGSRSLFFSSGDGSYAGVAQSNLSTAANTRYLLRFDYRRSSGNFKVQVGWGSEADFQTTPLVVNSGQGWQRATRYFTTPASAGDLRVSFTTDSSASNKVTIDNVVLISAPSGSDFDSDGVEDSDDNCPTVANTNQADLDGDGLADACDNDADADSYPNGSDCASANNSKYRAVVIYSDDDADGISNGNAGAVTCIGAAAPAGFTLNSFPVDNCPMISNASQTDTDLDGTGDVCDSTPVGPPTPTPTSIATSTSTPMPTTVPADPTPTQVISTPEPTPTLMGPPTTTAVLTVLQKGTSFARLTISGRLTAGGESRNPIAAEPVRLICGEKPIAKSLTNTAGQVSFRVVKKKRSRMCYLAALGTKSPSVTVPRSR